MTILTLQTLGGAIITVTDKDTNLPSNGANVIMIKGRHTFATSKTENGHVTFL